MTSRRGFLQHISAATAVGLLAQLPGQRLWAMPVTELLPEPEETLLRELALRAIDAARSAGATFADVRLAVTQSVNVLSTYGAGGAAYGAPGRPIMSGPGKGSSVTYDVRVLVDGAWGLVADYDLTPDAVARAARTAVAVARANRPRHRRTLELAPAPVVADGRWVTPIERDPFAIPIREQGELQAAVLTEAAKVEGVTQVMIAFGWTRGTHVFASTDGSVIVQHLRFAAPSGSVLARAGDDTVGTQINELVWDGRGGYGYEVVADRAALAAKVVGAAERWVTLVGDAKAPIPAEVGRYDLVLGPGTMAQAVAATLVPALNLERVLGYRANREGTSFAAPPPEILGTYRVGSPLLTLHGNRSAPHETATVGWDEEGVKPEDHTVIREGVVVDYHTGRQSAAALAGIYARRGQTVRSNGCTQGSDLGPAVRAPNLVLEPGMGGASLLDLIRDTKRGFYVESGAGGSDQQLLNTQLNASSWAVRRITNGKLGAYVRDFAFQFITPQFWQSLDALGGTGGARRVVMATTDPTVSMATLRVVPARFRQVNVLSTGRTL